MHLLYRHVFYIVYDKMINVVFVVMKEVYCLNLQRLVIIPIYDLFLERISKTVGIEKKYMEIEEKGVKLRLTIVDTPGFNDAVNANEW